MNRCRTTRVIGVSLAALMTATLAISSADGAATSTRGVTTPKARRAGAQPSRYAAGAMPASARSYYMSVWGIDEVTTQLAESGQLVRFSYRIVDIGLAKPLLDKVANPSLVDERANVALSVPQMEKVGALRQAGSPEPGKTYWVLFSNRGGHVKAGDRVSVVVGPVRINGLIVQK